MNRIKVEEKLKSMRMSLFTAREFRDIFNVPEKTALTFISRNCKSGLFLKLRNSYYVLKDSNPSVYFVANKLYMPSYISLEKALSHYGIIPETVYPITSVTAKPTREFVTPRGIFSYQRLKQDVFTGYNPVPIENSVVLFAQPEKALVDYLYFVDLKKVALNERLYLKDVNKQRAIQFARLFRRPGLMELVEYIYAEQRKPRRIY